MSFKPATKTMGLLMIGLVFVGLVGLARAQDAPKPLLLDEHGELPCDDLLVRWDAFYADLHANPNSTGLISIATLPEKRRDGVFLKAWIERYTHFRGFDLSRFRIVRTTADMDMRINYWRIPAGAAEPVLDIDDSYEIPRTVKPFMFAREEEFEMVECSERDGGRFLWTFLKANPSARANLVFRNRSIRAAKRRSVEVSNNLVSHGVARHRIRVFLLKQARLPENRKPNSEFWYLP